MSVENEGDSQARQIIRRLERIESYLGLSAPPVEAPGPATPPAQRAFVEHPQGEVHSATPPTSPPTAPPTTLPTYSVRNTPLAASVGQDELASHTTARDSSARRLSIERWIGERWYAVLGAIGIVIGVGLFAKLAIERGWFAFPIIVRCLMGALFGLGLIGVGEYIRRRANDWAAAGIMAAGLGSIYASTYAAYRLYEPLTNSPGLAFTLLVCVAAFGIVLSLHARFWVIGVLSLAGGYLVPLLFYDTESSPLVMPAYLLALLGVGMVVSARAGGGFTLLRPVSSLGTIVLGGIWTTVHAKDEPLLAGLFILVAWLGIQLELVVSARRFGLNAGALGPWGAGWRARSLVLCLSITAWLVGLGILILHQSDAAPTWMAPAAVMVGTAIAGLVFAGHLEFLRDLPDNDLELLGVSYLFQACGCLFTTIALAFSGGTEVLAWFALALTGLGTGRRLNVKAFTWTAILSLTLATGRLLVYDSFGGLTTPLADVFGIVPSRWMGMVLFAGAAWIAAGAILLPKDATPSRRSRALAWLGVIVLLFAFFHEEADYGSIVMVWLGISILALHGATVLPRLGLRGASTLVWYLCLLPWTMVYAFDWSSTAWNHWLHPGLVEALILSAAAGWIVRQARSSGNILPRLGAYVLGTGVFLLFVGTSLEVSRLADLHITSSRGEMACVSLWWGAFALSLIGVGFRWRLAASRRFGLALMGVAALKALIVDLRDVPELWRVASYVGLGLLMLVVALVYSRLSAALDQESDGATPPA